MGWRQILDMILSQVIRRLVNLVVERGIGMAGRMGPKADAPESGADPDPARQKAQDEAARQIRETARMLKRGRF